MIRLSFTYPDEWKKYLDRQTQVLTKSNYLRLLLEIDLHNAFFIEESNNYQEIIKSHLDEIVDFVQTLDFAHTYHEILGKKLKGQEISIDVTEIKKILAENLKSNPVLIFSGSSIQVYRFLVVNLDLEELAISWADAVTAYINYLVIKNYVEISDISDIEIIRPENYTELLKLKEFIEELLDNE